MNTCIKAGHKGGKFSSSEGVFFRCFESTPGQLQIREGPFATLQIAEDARVGVGEPGMVITDGCSEVGRWNEEHKRWETELNLFQMGAAW